MTNPATTISVDGVEYAVDAEWRINEYGEHQTTVTVKRLDDGTVAATADWDGWLAEHSLGWRGEMLLSGRKAPRAAHERGMLTTLDAYTSFDHTALAWVRFTVAHEVTESPSAATDDGATSVTYSHRDGTVQSLTVVAYVTHAQQVAISDLLLCYVPHLERAPRPYVGIDPTCLHDDAFDTAHDEECALVSLDALAAALIVEIEAFLAETDPTA